MIIFKPIKKAKKIIRFIILIIIVLALCKIFSVEGKTMEVLPNDNLKFTFSKAIRQDDDFNKNNKEITSFVENSNKNFVNTNKYPKKYIKRDINDIEPFIYEGMNKEEKERLKKLYDEYNEELKKNTEGLIKSDEWKYMK